MRRWVVLKNGKLFWFKTDIVTQVRGARERVSLRLCSPRLQMWRGSCTATPWAHPAAHWQEPRDIRRLARSRRIRVH